MAVRLRITSDGRVEVDGYISSLRYNVNGAITFLVDTGSQKTILGPRDADTLGFPTASFPAYTGPPLIGIGGKGKPFDVGPCQIVLGDAEIVEVENVLYFRPEKEVKMRARAGGARRERRERVFALPSLLGTDILRKRRCVLEINYGSSTGEIRPE